MANGSPSVADVVARTIASGGTRFAFGHPGGEVVLLIDALRRSGVPFLLTHHETSAAFMALGHGEITGIPGVCVATLGPGATNLVTGVASGLLERAPLLALTGALSTAAPAGTTHQALDLNALYRPVTKASWAVRRDDAASTVRSALDLTRRPQRGSVHLSVPADVAAARAASPEDPAGSRKPALVLPEPDGMDRAARILATASRPAIIVGLGAVQTNAAEPLRALARALQAPVATLPKSKGVFPEDDPWFAGTLEMAGDDLVVEFLTDADAIIAVGVDPVEFDKPWRLQAPVIRVDEIPDPDGYVPVEVDLAGDVPATLQVLAQSSHPSGWPSDSTTSLRARLRALLRPDGDRLHPTDVVDTVRAALPREAIATSDVGAHKMLVGQAWSSYAPRTFFMANGLSSMGYSIPVATAACLLQPERSVVAFVGDGGLTMYLGELETLVRAGVDLLIVVFADRSLELIRRAQLRREVPTEGTSFADPDFSALGSVFGITSVEVDSKATLRKALPRLLTSHGVRLLAVRIDGDDYRF
ncbi:MAG TPA: thiamine pyrophosphate-binding protein [Candidatus Limnocylindrales bacterium]|nr:thiamine pyrophosphate-binding protein [Candidatus Limnocylindrales bacterium]